MLRASQNLIIESSEMAPDHFKTADVRYSRIILYTLAAVFSIAGLTDSIYLTVEHLTGETAGCIVTKGCAEVLGSKYAVIGKIPLAALGALVYFCAFSLATLAAFGYRRVEIFLMFLVQAMFAVTLWLLMLQAFVLRAFCDYCLLSAGLTILITGVVFAAYLSGGVNESRKPFHVS
jgi:uncharacterized membrane protein